MDIKTILFCLFGLNLFLGLFLLFIRIALPSHKNVGFWVVTSIFSAVGYLLLGLRDNIPDSLSIVVAQLLFFFGCFIRIFGLQKLLNKTISQTQNILFLVLSALYLSFLLYFTYVDNNMLIRTITIGITLSTLVAVSGVVLRDNNQKRNQLLFSSTSFLYFVFSGIFIFRIIGWIAFPSVRGVFNSSALNSFQFVSNMIIEVVTTMLFFAINNQMMTDKMLESTRNYHTLFKNNSSINLAIDFETGQIIDSNSAAIRFYGYSHEKILKMNISDINTLPPDLIKNELRLAIEGDKNYCHFQHRKANGQVHDVESFVTPVTIDGKRIIYSSINDITEKKKAERELLESQARLAEANATKDRFFSIIGHDLKSPFNSILGFSEIMLEQVREKNFEEVEEYAGIIHSSSVRAMNLLSNLLEWNRAQTGKIAFNPIRFELTAIIEEEMELLKDSAHQKSISLIPETVSEPLITADREMIKTILRNLISNAIKFTNPGGKISIGIQQGLNESVVSVADDGVGIGEMDRDKLFRIGSSFSMSGTNNEKGTGLGLILCKEFIEMHGGKIWHENNLPHGSIFKFSLPNRSIL